jgi:hypothetical protein
MSKINRAKVTCPKCNKEVDVEIWDSVNVTLDPEAKERILAKEFFLHKCPFCGSGISLNYQCLFHDMDKKLMIFKTNATKEELDDIETPFDDLKGEYRQRVVRTIDEFYEKVIIFENGYDDVAVELYKQYIQPSIEEHLGYECVQFFDIVDDKAVTVCLGEEETVTVDIDEKSMELAKSLAEFWTENGSFAEINAEFANEVLDYISSMANKQ